MKKHNRLLVLVLVFTILVSGCHPGAALPDAVAPTTEPTPQPSMTPTPAIPACQGSAGSIIREQFTSTILGANYWVSLYLPPCYNITAKQTYPVLYLLHGQSMDDTFWPSLGIAALADELIAHGAPKFLIIMPQEVLDYDPVLDSHFGDSVINELLPWAETTYHACASVSCRSIGGISRGGGWAMRLTVRNFGTFGSVGAHSMGLMPGDWWRAEKLLETHAVTEFPRIYMDRGDKDYLAKDIDFFENVLTENHIPHEFYISPGLHEAKYWQAHVAEYLAWYVEGWE
jgi:enterochelin esterase-like enzyme